MSTPPREVSLLKQQVSALRAGPASPTHSAPAVPRSPRRDGAALKVALLGPLQAGKTKISSQIVNAVFPNRYEPTAGVRILELEESLTDADETAQAVELWDCSGDQKFEACWPAICDKLDGAIVAFDPTNKSQANDVRIWCEWFCKRAGLSDGQVVIFAHGELSGHHKPLSVRAGERTVVVPIVNVSTINLPPPDEDGRTQPGPAKLEFRKFLNSVHEFVSGGGGAPADD